MEGVVKKYRRFSHEIVKVNKDLETANVFKLFQKMPNEKILNLKRVYLAGNKLDCIPSCLYDCVNLETLQLSNNRITVVTDDIVKLKLLKNLWLAENQLTRISPRIIEMKVLEDINLWKNPKLPLFMYRKFYRFDEIQQKLSAISLYYTRLTQALCLLWCGKMLKHILPMDIWKMIAHLIIKNE